MEHKGYGKMINLEKLLICDGKPSQELIDYQLDKVVQKMIDEYLTEPAEGKDIAQENLLNIENKLSMADNTFVVYTQAQFFDETLDGIEKSMSRYAPFLKFDPRAEDPRRKRQHKKAEKIIGIGVCLLLEIDPQMKKAMLLNQQLPQKEPSQNNRLKV